MKYFTLLLTTILFSFTACVSDDSAGDSTTGAENTNQNGDEDVNGKKKVNIEKVAFIIPDGTYDVSKNTPMVQWKAKKIDGSGHTGLIPVSNGKFAVAKGIISGGVITFNLAKFTATDIEGEDLENFNQHLRSDAFFKTEEFPTAILTFVSSYERDGDVFIKTSLEICGVTQVYEIPIDIKPSEEDGITKYYIYGETTIDRTKHNVTYGSGSLFDNLGDRAINDEVTITFEFIAV